MGERGLFVVFEGGDGVGKTTQISALERSLSATGVDHLVTRQPGGTELGAEIRRLLLSPDCDAPVPRAEALLYAADKAQHVERVVQPALDAGQVVLSDRYVDSMLVYQSAGRGLALADVRGICDWATAGLSADLTILLDVEPEHSVQKIAAKDRLEAAGADFHRRVREGFLDLAAAQPENYLVLPARDSVASIAARVRQAVGVRLGIELRTIDL